MSVKRMCLEKLSLYKIHRVCDAVTMYLVSASGEQIEWSLDVYTTDHVLFTGENSNYFGSRVKAICEARLRKVEGGCEQARKHVVFEKSKSRRVYATSTEHVRRYGTTSVMECLVVHRLAMKCKCALCTRISDIFTEIVALAGASNVRMYRHCEIPCNWMNAVVRKLQGRDNVVGHLSVCRVYYMSTSRDKDGFLKAFMLLRPDTTVHTEQAICTTSSNMWHEAVGVCTNKKNVVMWSSSRELERSLLTILERECDVLVVYDDKLYGLQRTLLVDMWQLYENLPKNTTGVHSDVKLGVDMFNGLVASRLDQWVAHDLHGSQFILNGDVLVNSTIAYNACVLCGLDKVRGLVALCLETQRWSCIPVCHGSRGTRIGPGRPTAMRNSLVATNTGDVLMPMVHTQSSIQLAAPCKFRTPLLAVKTGCIVQLDFVSFYSSIIIEQCISSDATLTSEEVTGH
jgi:hypothetical protein